MEKRVEARAPHVGIVFQIPCPVEQGRRSKTAPQPVSHEMSERRHSAGAARGFSIECGCKIGGRVDALSGSVIYVINERILIALSRSAGVLIPSWIEQKMRPVTPVRAAEQIVHDRIQPRHADLGIFGQVPIAIEDPTSRNEPPPADPRKTRERIL